MNILKKEMTMPHSSHQEKGSGKQENSRIFRETVESIIQLLETRLKVS